MKVTRYDWTEETMASTSNGDYVSYEDYESLEDQLREKEELIADIKELAEEIRRKI
jgi:hypothetical protein